MINEIICCIPSIDRKQILEFLDRFYLTQLYGKPSSVNRTPSGKGIVFLDKNWMERFTEKAIKGAIIYELAHIFELSRCKENRKWSTENEKNCRDMINKWGFSSPIKVSFSNLRRWWPPLFLSFFKGFFVNF